MVRIGAGGLIYRQIKSLHCSGYLLVLLIYRLFISHWACLKWDDYLT